MKEIKFNINLEEANLILEGLGKLPFERVFNIVNKLQAQASSQLQEENESGPFLGKGWSFPPIFYNQGKELNIISGPENVHKSIWVIMNTRLGERVMTEGFGAGLQNLHFEPLGSRLVNNLKRTIGNTILLHESRIKLDNVSVSASKQQDGLLLIELHYTIKSTNSRYNLVFPFYLDNNQ